MGEDVPETEVQRAAGEKGERDRGGVGWPWVESARSYPILCKIERMFFEADTDGSGLIEFDEFCQLVTALIPPLGGREG